MAKSGLALFLIIVLSIWALMHAYVFWRVASVPWVTAHATRRHLIIAAVVLWASYPLARMLNSFHYHAIGMPLEFLATLWLGFLFLAVAALLVTDICTLGGLLLPRPAATLPGWAVMVAAILSLIALVQGLRPPVIRDYEITLPGLPPERDGLTVVAIADMHLGTLLGERWMSRLIERVDALKPEAVFVVGDLVDGNVDQVQALAPVLRKLRAPLGVWCVTGNHEYYAGVERSVALMESAGYNVLRDRWAEVAPGLIVAGVDDLTARRQFGIQDRPLDQALDEPAGGRGDSVVAHALGSRTRGGWRGGIDAFGPYPQRPDLAVQLSGTTPVPFPVRPIPGPGHDAPGGQGLRNLGPPDAALGPGRNPAAQTPVGNGRQMREEML